MSSHAETPPARTTQSWFARIPSLLGWTRTSYTFMGVFTAIIGLIIYVWWPLVEEYLEQFNPAVPWWRQVDWLLLGIFAVMSLLIMAGADIRRDALMVFVGLAGGLVIESWGTQTEIWTYYTFERPPLWIIPAWPVATLSIDRLVTLLVALAKTVPDRFFVVFYWLGMGGFSALMLAFVMPTAGKSLTIMAIVLCALLIVTPRGYRLTFLTFAAGSGLGYFLELWGTTRLCWTYYTLQQPPVFAVFAHGMAAVAFWRVRLLFEVFYGRFSGRKEPA